jgi:dipeptidyl aminopeptidase/acylaminoacyl peptidase
MKRKSIPVYIVLMLSLSGLTFFLWKVYVFGNGILISRLHIQTNTVKPTPTLMPAYDLTIPYLRSRRYTSNLGSLEKVSDYETYSSYLTSYTSDGLKINGLLTRPRGAEPVGGWPGIVFVHGYIPPNQYQTLGQPYSAYVDYLARNEFVVFKIDLRGHGTSQGQARGGYYSSDYVVDTLNAYAALESADYVNPNKIGLWGHSMAGNTLLRAFAVRPTIPAVVIWAGAGYTYVDLSEYGLHDASYQPQPRPTGSTESARPRNTNQARQIYGDPRNGNPFWKLVAATNYLNDLKGAIQLDQATDDETVSIKYNQNLNTLLNATSVVHEFNEFPSGGHNISGENFTTAMEKTVGFFNTYLKGD